MIGLGLERAGDPLRFVRFFRRRWHMKDDYICPQTLHQRRQAGQATTIIDIRDSEEYAAGHIPGARHIPADKVATRLDEIPNDQLTVPY